MSKYSQQHLLSASAAGGFEASGGNVRDAYDAGNGYKYHTFTTPGNFVVTGTGDIDVMIVAGGAGAAGGYSAGSGGGGVVRHTQFECTAGTYPIVIGAGGASAETNSAVPGATQGGDSTAFGMTAKGGGAGGSYPSSASGNPGGSGGGEQDAPMGAGAGIQPSQNAPFVPQTGFNQYGYKGGEGATVGAYAAAGGGGAGAEGGTSPGPGPGGPGGPGIAMPGMEYSYVGLPGIQPLMPEVNSPTSNHYGAGGGGWGYAVQISGSRPIGGGGRGGSGAPAATQQAIDYLGGGGGNNYYIDFTPTGGGGGGGEGIVVIRYPA